MPDTNMDAQRHAQRDDQRDDAKQSSAPPPQDRKDDGRKPAARWPFMLAGLIVLAFIGFVLYRIFAPTPDIWTNDAYIRVHYARISPRIAGHVATVEVGDNQEVKAGQVLATLDPRPYQAVVDEAEGALAHAEAEVNNAGANVHRQPALISEAQAAVSSDQAQLAFARHNADRYRHLAPSGAVTAQQLQQANTALAQAQAAMQHSQAALQAAQQQMGTLQAMQQAARATVQSDKARLYQARLNLGYTKITAPLDGMVGERSVQVGDYVSPGNTLMTVVPLAQAYVVANYREVALQHVLPGQKVTVHVDAYNITLHGVVNSIAPATGDTFSPIPPSNATGNFTKIVQRLPVKITFAPNQPQATLLRDGFSAETTIHTHLAQVVGTASPPGPNQ